MTVTAADIPELVASLIADIADLKVETDDWYRRLIGRSIARTMHRVEEAGLIHEVVDALNELPHRAFTWRDAALVARLAKPAAKIA